MGVKQDLLWFEPQQARLLFDQSFVHHITFHVGMLDIIIWLQRNTQLEENSFLNIILVHSTI